MGLMDGWILGGWVQVKAVLKLAYNKNKVPEVREQKPFGLGCNNEHLKTRLVQYSNQAKVS
jgi:hypothetical protein